MLDQRERSEWRRSSSLMTVIAGVFAGKGKKPKFEEFDPFAAADRPKLKAADFGHMMGFTKPRKGNP